MIAFQNKLNKYLLMKLPQTTARLMILNVKMYYALAVYHANLNLINNNDFMESTDTTVLL